MSDAEETPEMRSQRIRKAQIAIIVSFAWWIVSIGGIIYVINVSA